MLSCSNQKGKKKYILGSSSKGCNIWAPRIKREDVSPENTMGVVVRISHCLLSDSPCLTLCYPTTPPPPLPSPPSWKKKTWGEPANPKLFLFWTSLPGFGLRCRGGESPRSGKTIDEKEDGAKRVREHGFPKWRGRKLSVPFSFLPYQVCRLVAILWLVWEEKYKITTTNAK